MVTTAVNGKGAGHESVTPPPDGLGEIAGLRALSDLLSRAQIAGAAGLTFGGKRDLDEALGYKKELGPADYRDRYRRGGVAGRLVDAYPKATWGAAVELVEDQDPEVTTEFEAAWAELAGRLKTWGRLYRLDVLAGLGRYAVLLIGASGKLEEPLEQLSGPDELLYLQPYAEEDAEIDKYVEEPEDPRFGLPEFYKLSRTSTRRESTGSVSSQTRRVHWSRMLHVAEGLLDDDVFGLPRLERPWNRLDDLDKVTGGGSEAIWLRGHQGYHLDLDKDTKVSADELAKMREESDEFIHGMRRMLRTRGAKMETLGSDVADFSRPADAILSQISGATGIPKRILTGSERGDLASRQDRHNWNERVQERREQFAEPEIIRPLVDRFIALGVLPEPLDGYEVRWPELAALNETERADVVSKVASAVKAVSETLEAEDPVVDRDEFRDRWLGLPPKVDVMGAPRGASAAVPRRLADDEDFDDVDATADEPEWAAIHRAADRNRARVERLFVDSLEEVRAAMSLSALEEALAAGDAAAIDQLVVDAIATLERKLPEPLEETLLVALVAGAEATVRSIAAGGGLPGGREPGLVLSFDQTNPLAVQWAAVHSSQLIREVSESTRDAVRAVVARAFDEGLPPRESARVIRDLVGLTERQSTAVANLRARLAAAEPGSLVMAGKTRIRVPKAGADAAFIQRNATRYASKLHRRRALVIARTETIASANEGQRQLWLQARGDGLLTGSERRKWIVTPDDRLDSKICAPMDGQLRGLEEPFVTPQGNEVMGPPAHPQCRCATALELVEPGGPTA